MALLAEELVEEWLNRHGYFTIRGVKLGVHEMDLFLNCFKRQALQFGDLPTSSAAPSGSRERKSLASGNDFAASTSSNPGSRNTTRSMWD